MRRAHRTAHRLLWWLLTPAALALLWFAVAGRPADPLASVRTGGEPGGDAVAPRDGGDGGDR